MAREIRVPRLGWSMEEGTFVGWLKKDGDSVQVGESLFELEGEKAIQEIPAIDAGILRIPPDAPRPGTVLPVGSLVGYLADEGEPLPWTVPSTPPSRESMTLASPSPESLSIRPVCESAPVEELHSRGGDSQMAGGEKQRGALGVPASPSVRRLARAKGVTLTSIFGSGPGGKVTAADVEQAARAPASLAAGMRSASPVRKFASPRARAVARDLGIDWTTVDGTGRGGRVRERDVRRAVSLGSGRSLAAATLESLSEIPQSLLQPVRVPLTSIRKVTADRMRKSHARLVPVTLHAVADAENLVAFRQTFKAMDGAIVPAITDIIACLTARVLRRHRAMAARWEEDGAALTIPADDGMHLGIAVDTARGLLVPVLRDVANQTLLEIARQARELVEKARASKLSTAQMQGGVFTISNLGSFGVDRFTPVIHYPETAILGLGAIRRVPVVLADDRIVPRGRMTLSLTFDHCATDGAPAAQFLRALVAAIEEPTTIPV